MTSRKHTVWAWIVGTLLAVVLYVLSSGPAYAAMERCPSFGIEYQWAFGAFSIIYAPIIQVAQHSPLALHVLEWYLSLWV